MVRAINIVVKVLLLCITLILISKFTISKIEQYKQDRNFNSPISMAERERQLTCLANIHLIFVMLSTRRM